MDHRPSRTKFLILMETVVMNCDNEIKQMMVPCRQACARFDVLAMATGGRGAKDPCIWVPRDQERVSNGTITSAITIQDLESRGPEES